MSTFSIGLLNQLGDAFESNGWTARDVTKLKQSKKLRDIMAVLNGEAEITFPEKKWFEVGDMIYIKVISDGTTGKQWIERLEKKGFNLSKDAKELLLSEDFKATIGIVYTIAILRGNLFTDSNRITKTIRSEAVKRKLVIPNLEVACLIREMFSNNEIKAMGINWLVTFHEPIKNSYGGLDLLGTHRRDDGDWLATGFGGSSVIWNGDDGFAFEVSQVSL